MTEKIDEIFKKVTLDCVINTISEKYASKTAIIFDNHEITYSDLVYHSRNLALHLLRIGIRKDDKVAILLSNKIEYLYSYFSLFLIGAWATPINTRYEPGELRNVLKDSDVSAIIYENRIGTFDYDNILNDFADDLPDLKLFIRLGSEKKEGTHYLPDFINLEEQNTELMEKLDSIQIEPEDVALLAYTSGTTGSPKGVMIPHRNLVYTSFYTGQIWEFENEVGFSIAPLYAAQGFLAVLTDLVSGITMKWIHNFNPNDIVKHLVKEGVNAFHTQPTMWSLLMSLPFFKELTFDNVEKVAVSGSLCPVNLAQKIEETIKCKLVNAYGLIEATGVVTVTSQHDSEAVRLSTVGRPIPGVEIKIVDENREKVEQGKTGELAVKGYLMKGYYKNLEKTKEVIDEDGWLYTGDLACFFDDENIRIVGRNKDMVIRGGFNVYPIDIEECLLSFDKVEDVSVVGREHELLGESLVTFVVPKPDADLTEGEVRRYCRGKISNYKIPDEVILVSQLPIILSGKVQKNVLREWAEKGVPDECRILFNGRSILKN